MDAGGIVKMDKTFRFVDAYNGVEISYDVVDYILAFDEAADEVQDCPRCKGGGCESCDWTGEDGGLT